MKHLTLFENYSNDKSQGYTLDAGYYDKSFKTIDELIDDVMSSGMDPNYEILFNGKGTGEMAIDLIQF
jgi:hypothetical protein